MTTMTHYMIVYMSTGLARIPVQFRQEEFRFSGQKRTVAVIQTIVSIVGQEWTVTRKIGPGETDAGCFGRS